MAMTRVRWRTIFGTETFRVRRGTPHLRRIGLQGSGTTRWLARHIGMVVARCWCGCGV